MWRVIVVRVLKGTIAVWAFALFWACSVASAEIGQVSLELQRRLDHDSVSSTIGPDRGELRSPQLLQHFYAERAYAPAWMLNGQLSDNVAVLLEALAAADEEGLRPQDYLIAAIGDTLPGSEHDTVLTPPQLADLDLLLSDAFLAYAADLLAGRPAGRAAGHRSGLKGRAADTVAILQEALENRQIRESLQALRPTYPGYERLRKGLALYQTLERRGGWRPVGQGKKLSEGSRGPRVKALRDRLLVTGDLKGEIGQRDPAERDEGGLLKVADTGALPSGVPGDGYLFDNALSEAVKRFQKRQGLLEDGVVGSRTLAALNVPVSERMRQIELNMERLRWLPENLGQRYILVNIPDFRMRVVEGDEDVLDAEVIVGQPKRPTPVFSGNMSYLVMSPRWYIPYSIAVKDKLPVLRRDPYALYRQGIHIFAANGREVDPGMINWRGVSRHNFPYRLRQEPGSRNALGRIKFIFPNPHHVYLHDTPQTHLFRRSERAFSSGCVRVSKPMELAEYLLKQDSAWDRKRIASVSRGKRERHVNLPENIPVHLLYWTAWVNEDGTVNFRRDIYGHDRGLAKVLFAG